jgi:hypothetical protein
MVSIDFVGEVRQWAVEEHPRMSRETVIQTPPTESDLLQEVYRRVVQIHYPLAEGVGLTEREERCYRAVTDLLDFLEAAPTRQKGWPPWSVSPAWPAARQGQGATSTARSPTCPRLRTILEEQRAIDGADRPHHPR